MKGCKFWPRHSWPLSSEGSLACHTYCVTGPPFIMVISEDPWHSTYYWAFGSGAVTTWSVAAGICTPNLLLAGRTLYTHCTTALIAVHVRQWSYVLKGSTLSSKIDLRIARFSPKRTWIYFQYILLQRNVVTKAIGLKLTLINSKI